MDWLLAKRAECHFVGFLFLIKVFLHFHLDWMHHFTVLCMVFILGCLDFAFVDGLLLGYISPPFSSAEPDEVLQTKPLGEIDVWVHFLW